MHLGGGWRSIPRKGAEAGVRLGVHIVVCAAAAGWASHLPHCVATHRLCHLDLRAPDCLHDQRFNKNSGRVGALSQSIRSVWTETGALKDTGPAGACDDAMRHRVRFSLHVQASVLAMRCMCWQGGESMIAMR